MSTARDSRPTRRPDATSGRSGGAARSHVVADRPDEVVHFHSLIPCDLEVGGEITQVVDRRASLPAALADPSLGPGGGGLVVLVPASHPLGHAPSLRSSAASILRSEAHTS